MGLEVVGIMGRGSEGSPQLVKEELHYRGAHNTMLPAGGASTSQQSAPRRSHQKRRQRPTGLRAASAHGWRGNDEDQDDVELHLPNPNFAPGRQQAGGNVELEKGLAKLRARAKSTPPVLLPLLASKSRSAAEVARALVPPMERQSIRRDEPAPHVYLDRLLQIERAHATSLHDQMNRVSSVADRKARHLQELQLAYGTVQRAWGLPADGDPTQDALFSPSSNPPSPERLRGVPPLSLRSAGSDNQQASSAQQSTGGDEKAKGDKGAAAAFQQLQGRIQEAEANTEGLLCTNASYSAMEDRYRSEEEQNLLKRKAMEAELNQLAQQEASAQIEVAEACYAAKVAEEAVEAQRGGLRGKRRLWESKRVMLLSCAGASAAVEERRREWEEKAAELGLAISLADAGEGESAKNGGAERQGVGKRRGQVAPILEGGPVDKHLPHHKAAIAKFLEAYSARPTPSPHPAGGGTVRGGLGMALLRHSASARCLMEGAKGSLTWTHEEQRKPRRLRDEAEKQRQQEALAAHMAHISAAEEEAAKIKVAANSFRHAVIASQVERQEKEVGKFKESFELVRRAIGIGYEDPQAIIEAMQGTEAAKERLLATAQGRERRIEELQGELKRLNMDMDLGTSTPQLKHQSVDELAGRVGAAQSQLFWARHVTSAARQLAGEAVIGVSSLVKRLSDLPLAQPGQLLNHPLSRAWALLASERGEETSDSMVEGVLGSLADCLTALLQETESAAVKASTPSGESVGMASLKAGSTERSQTFKGHSSSASLPPRVRQVRHSSGDMSAKRRTSGGQERVENERPPSIVNFFKGLQLGGGKRQSSVASTHRSSRRGGDTDRTPRSPHIYNDRVSAASDTKQQNVEEAELHEDADEDVEPLDREDVKALEAEHLRSTSTGSEGSDQEAPLVSGGYIRNHGSQTRATVSRSGRPLDHSVTPQLEESIQKELPAKKLSRFAQDVLQRPPQ